MHHMALFDLREKGGWEAYAFELEKPITVY